MLTTTAAAPDAAPIPMSSTCGTKLRAEGCDRTSRAMRLHKDRGKRCAGRRAARTRAAGRGQTVAARPSPAPAGTASPPPRAPAAASQPLGRCGRGSRISDPRSQIAHLAGHGRQPPADRVVALEGRLARVLHGPIAPLARRLKGPPQQVPSGQWIEGAAPEPRARGRSSARPIRKPCGLQQQNRQAGPKLKRSRHLTSSIMS